jgi:hypothetical protein
MAQLKRIDGFLYTMVDKFCCSSEHICGMMMDLGIHQFEADLKTHHIVQDALRIPRNTNLVRMVGTNLQSILNSHYPETVFESMRLFNTYGEPSSHNEGRLSCWIELRDSQGNLWCAGLENDHYKIIGKRRRKIKSGGSRNVSSIPTLVAAMYQPNNR